MRHTIYGVKAVPRFSQAGHWRDRRIYKYREWHLVSDPTVVWDSNGPTEVPVRCLPHAGQQPLAFDYGEGTVYYTRFLVWEQEFFDYGQITYAEWATKFPGYVWHAHHADGCHRNTVWSNLRFLPALEHRELHCSCSLT